LVPPGVDEFPPVAEADLRQAMPVLATVGATLMVHAELPQYVLAPTDGDGRHYAAYLASRPPVAETEAVELVSRLAAEYGTRVHIVHVSSAESLAVIRPERLADWMSAAPARLAGLALVKGSIAAGCDADIVVWDPEETITVREDRLFNRHKLTPYLGRTLYGRVRATFVGGQVAYRDDVVSATPAGRLLTRERQ